MDCFFIGIYEKLLTANLQRAVDFVKFAETKNAALLALSSAWVVAALNLDSWIFIRKQNYFNKSHVTSSCL